MQTRDKAQFNITYSVEAKKKKKTYIKVTLLTSCTANSRIVKPAIIVLSFIVTVMPSNVCALSSSSNQYGWLFCETME